MQISIIGAGKKAAWPRRLGRDRVGSINLEGVRLVVLGGPRACT